jgi:hypothetical protein
MKKNIGFRGWFYFRQGWSTYFAFIFAAINTLIVSYYLAIENIPTLKIIFPSFYAYLLIVISIGIPLLILVGYAHQKKTPSYRAEATVHYESNPHALRTYNEIELLLRLNIKSMSLLLSDYEKNNIPDERLDEFIKIKTEIETYFAQMKNNPDVDLELFKKFIGLK